MEYRRVNHGNYLNVKKWFDIASNVLRNPALLPSNIYNMDETGIQLGMLGTVKVIVPAGPSRNTRGAPQTRESVTAIECIAADGTYLPPMVIFASKTHRDSWYDHGATPGWVFANSPRGYTDDELSLAWLKKVFNKHTEAKAGGLPRLLITNGHGSHEMAEFLSLCFEHNITLLQLPSHTSHLLQPLDVKCFAPLKHYYRNEVDGESRGGTMVITKQHVRLGFADRLNTTSQGDKGITIDSIVIAGSSRL
jgi:hypothetical protein